VSSTSNVSRIGLRKPRAADQESEKSALDGESYAGVMKPAADGFDELEHAFGLSFFFNAVRRGEIVALVKISRRIPSYLTRVKVVTE